MPNIRLLLHLWAQPTFPNKAKSTTEYVCRVSPQMKILNTVNPNFDVSDTIVSDYKETLHIDYILQMINMVYRGSYTSAHFK